MSKARIYVRVSRPGEESILKNQLDAALKYCSDMGIEAEVYKDEGVSGGTDNRPALNRLMHDLRRGDVVVMTSMSRLTRGGVHSALDLLRQFEAYGASWVFTEQPMLSNSANTPPLVRNVLLAILAEVDADYRRRISEKTRAAYARKKALADAAGLKVAWGRKKRHSPPWRPESGA